MSPAVLRDQHDVCGGGGVGLNTNVRSIKKIISVLPVDGDGVSMRSSTITSLAFLRDSPLGLCLVL